MLAPLEANIFDSIAGLPLHPLVVHFVVVLVPLTALSLLLLVMAPKLADRFGWVTLLLLAVGTGAAFVAEESGQALALRLGEPQLHATLGRVLPFVSAALLAVALTWFLLQRRAFKAQGHRSSGSTAAAVITAILALAVTALAVAVGHLGATAVWGQTLTPVPSVAPLPTPSASPTDVATPTAPASSPAATPSSSSSASAKGYTMAEVGQHAGASSCWIVVEGQVYDATVLVLTSTNQPPALAAFCGTDASSAFVDTAKAPAKISELAPFLLGPLS
jgi:uncharacterized membrane protein